MWTPRSKVALGLAGSSAAALPLIALLGGGPKLQQLGFVGALVATTWPAFCWCKVVVILESLFPGLKRSEALTGISYKWTAFCWSWVPVLTWPWIRIRCVDHAAFKKAVMEGHPRPLVVLANHSSFFDAIIKLAHYVPRGLLGHTRAWAGGHLFKLPVIGTLSSALHHLKVPFKATGDDATDFSTDRTEMLKTKELADKHLSSGGTIFAFPEGMQNRGDPTALLQFRAGGFEQILEQDCEVWGVVSLGHQHLWHPKVPIGGLASNIEVRFVQIRKRLGEARAEPAEGEPTLREQAKALADHSRNLMQAEMDKIVANGWASGAEGMLASS